MKTFSIIAEKTNIPITTVWSLGDLRETRGKHERFLKQSHTQLSGLRKRALIESAISSNRIEGVTIDQSRIETYCSVMCLCSIAKNKKCAVTLMRST